MPRRPRARHVSRYLPAPDLGSFCRLDELGLQVVGQRLEPGRAVLACWVAEGVRSSHHQRVQLGWASVVAWTAERRAASRTDNAAR